MLALMVRRKTLFSTFGFLLLFLQGTKRGKQKVGRGNRGKEKKRTSKGRDLYNIGKGHSFVNFFFHNSRPSPILNSTPKRVLHEKQV
jgi:hypothetical protein